MTSPHPLRALLAAATAAPWEVDIEDGPVYIWGREGSLVVSPVVETEADAALIVALRNGAEELLDDLESTRTERDDARMLVTLLRQESAHHAQLTAKLAAAEAECRDHEVTMSRLEDALAKLAAAEAEVGRLRSDLDALANASMMLTGPNTVTDVELARLRELEAATIARFRAWDSRTPEDEERAAQQAFEAAAERAIARRAAKPVKGGGE